MAKAASLHDVPPTLRTWADELLRWPVASAPHLVLDEQFLGNRRVFIVGDVHGCHDELQQLLSKVGIGVASGDAVTIFVGDLVAKGPQTREVLDLVRKLGALSVRGNQDQNCLRQMTLLREGAVHAPDPGWDWIRGLTDEDYQQLGSLPYTISLPSLRSVIVHACLLPGIPLESQDVVDMMAARNLVRIAPDNSEQTSKAPPRYQATSRKDIGEAWASLWPGPEHVYFGHNASRGLQRCEFATGLDTGCVYGQQLTGAFLTDEKQLVQVDAKQIYCRK